MAIPTPPPALIDNANMADDAVRRLISQFRNKPNIETLAYIYAQELQELNDAALALLNEITLTNAVGAQLDGLGQIIGVERKGLSDDAYRSRLRGQILINTGSGTIEQLIDIVNRTINTDPTDKLVVHEEQYPAGFTIEFLESVTVEIGESAAESVYQGKAAGVHGIFEFFHLTPVFAFDGLGGSKFDGGYYMKTAIRNRGGRESEIL